jgi:hypothetical protein
VSDSIFLLFRFGGWDETKKSYQYTPPLHMDGVPLPPGIPGLGGSTDPLEAVLGTFPCVRIRNLPYDAAIEDILLLLQGLVVIDVLLVDRGTAFVIFANPMDFQMALQRYVSLLYISLVANRIHKFNIDPVIASVSYNNAAEIDKLLAASLWIYRQQPESTTMKPLRT